jgi:hypothetical protein
MRWPWRRARPITDADRRRAEALVQVEALGMMGGKPPHLRLTPVIRAPRRRPAEITHEPE